MRTILPLLILVLGCASEKPDSDTITLGRCSESTRSDPFARGNVSFDSGDLLVEVQFSGGCARHSFAMCWDGAVIDTQPPTIDLLMTHDAHGDSCESLSLQDVRVDITPLIEVVHDRTYLNVVSAFGSLPGTNGT